ncbi:MAG TPA: GYD domain-containing protein [Burkholderiaceae bacterium]
MNRYVVSFGYAPESHRTAPAAGTSRVDAISRAVESLGGRLEFLNFVLGDCTGRMIVGLPDATSAAALSAAAKSTGAVSVACVSAPDLAPAGGRA